MEDTIQPVEEARNVCNITGLAASPSQSCPRVCSLNFCAVLLLHPKEFTSEPLKLILFAREMGLRTFLVKFWECERAEGTRRCEMKRIAESQMLTILCQRYPCFVCLFFVHIKITILSVCLEFKNGGLAFFNLILPFSYLSSVVGIEKI